MYSARRMAAALACPLLVAPAGRVYSRGVQPDSEPSPAPSVSSSDGKSSGLRLSDAIGRLKVAGESCTGYQRDTFRLWTDADHDGCDTRKEWERPRTRMAGVVPRLPQVREVGGVIENPASSSKTIQAPSTAAVLPRVATRPSPSRPLPPRHAREPGGPEPGGSSRAVAASGRYPTTSCSCGTCGRPRS